MKFHAEIGDTFSEIRKCGFHHFVNTINVVFSNYTFKRDTNLLFFGFFYLFFFSFWVIGFKSYHI